MRFNERPLTARLNPWGGANIEEHYATPLRTVEQPKEQTPASARPTVYNALSWVMQQLIDLNSDAALALHQDWQALAERTAQFLDSEREARRKWLREQVAELTPQCRRELDELNRLRGEGRSLEGQWNTLNEGYSRANLRLTTARNEQPLDEGFPTDEEIAAWQRKVRTAEAAVTREENKREELRQRIDANARERRAVALRLQELKERRQQYRDELAGRPRPGPFGLRAMEG